MFIIMYKLWGGSGGSNFILKNHLIRPKKSHTYTA